QAVMNAANGDITVSGDVTGQTNVLATTTGTGNISINGVVKSTNAAVKATTETGNIKIAKTVDAKSDAVFNSSVQGNIDLEGAVTAGQNITAQTKSGAVTAKGNLLAGNAVQAVSNNGTVTLEGNVTATQDKVNVEATNGDAVFSGNVTAGTIVNARATEGNVIVSGSVTSNGGDTTLTATDSQKNVAAGNITVGGTIRSAAQAVMNAANGDITVSGDVTGQTNVLATTTGTGNISIDGVVKSTNAAVKATTETGNITIGGNVAAGTDLIAQTVNGNIGFNGTVTTGNDMTAQTIDNGNIIFNGAVNVGNNLLADAVKTGGITLRQNITAGQNLTMHTNDGTILLEGNNSNVTEDVVATAKNGDINITVTGTGDVKDTHRTVNGDRGFVKSEKGNVIIDHQGKGIVDLYEVFAKKEARIATKDGDLYLNNVDGNLVALIVRNPEKKMDVKHITAGTEVAFNGADISVDNISQRPESEGVLAITLKGASDDVPVDRLHLGDIQTNSGVRFKQVWLKNGDISVTKGDFILDKLYILDKATFSNGTMTTNVFGTAPIPEETITSTYWNNTKINNPKEDLANWFRDGQNNKWMNLRFDGQKNVQFSNGNLLSLLPHNYVYNERYTQETWSRIFQDRDYYNFYGHYYNPDVSFHNRYDLIEVQGPGVSNAKPADIVIQ
ncbi:MAG: hypothetical protein LKF74_07275, partial [Megasphaera sp.]|nr:hypothetical protein [Megasphaera sp.]